MAGEYETDIFSKRKGKKCVCYVRVSSELQIQGFSLTGQVSFLKNFAERDGMTITGVYSDEGKSGKSIEGRDEFQRMLQDITVGDVEADFVLVFKLSRFGRNARDILNSLEYIMNFGIHLLCVEDMIDSSTSTGKLLITILGAVAEMERENISVQTMLGRNAKAKAGGWNGGFAPYGYELNDGKLIPVEEEAKIVKLIFDKFVNGSMGYSTIANYLNKQGITREPAKNSHGRKFNDWSACQVKRILDNPLYTGHIAFGRRRTTRVEGTENKYIMKPQNDYIISECESHEALVSDELFDKARKKRKETGIKGNPKIGRERAHLLSGILKCPQCGSSMFIDKNMWTNKDGTKRETFSYVCGHYKSSTNSGNCKRNGISAELVEKEVLEYTKALVSNPIFAEDVRSRIGKSVDVSAIEAEIANYRNELRKTERNKANLERDMDNISDDDKNAERKRKDMNRRLNSLYERIYDLETRIENCELTKAGIEKEALTLDAVYQMLLEFDKIFDKLNDADKRTLIQSMISEIQLFGKGELAEGHTKTFVKSIKYAFPVADEILDSLRENLSHVETVALLRREENIFRL